MAAPARWVIRSARRARGSWSRCCTRWRRGLKRGVAAICIGGGEGTAIAIERV
jgi:acetyl-CoA acetyltransferase